MLITGPQCRAARAFLGWTRADLAAASAVSIQTIKALEVALTELSDKTNENIAKAFIEAGIIFVLDAVYCKPDKQAVGTKSERAAQG